MRTQDLAGNSVLVVEDEGLIALELQELLQEAGARVLTARSAGQALSIAEKAKLGLAIVDYQLGAEDAGEVCRRLRADAVPFFFFAAETESLKAEWPDVPTVDKPSSPETILAAATALLERGSA